jgi:hypothetical protein
MKQIKVSEATNTQLDWLVGVAEGCYDLELYGVDPSIRAWKRGLGVTAPYRPTTNWSQMGPIIERERITVVCAEGEYNPDKAGTPQCYDTYWVATFGRLTPYTNYGPQGDNWGDAFTVAVGGNSGNTPLIAAARCFVSSKLGETVEVPDEL